MSTFETAKLVSRGEPGERKTCTCTEKKPAKSRPLSAAVARPCLVSVVVWPQLS